MSNNTSSSSESDYSDNNGFDGNKKSKRKLLAKKVNIKSKQKLKDRLIDC